MILTMTGYGDDLPRSSPSPYRWPLLAIVLLIGVLVWRVSGLGISPRRPLYQPDAEMRPVVARGDLGADEQATIALFKQAAPSVVLITSLRNGTPIATGSGFVWDEDGNIVTNWHVLRDADTVAVTLSDRTTWSSRLVGSVPARDLAVLKIDAPAGTLHPILIGTSHDLQVGQKVFAIGNPFGLDQTMTTGIISQLGRDIPTEIHQTISGVIQTDAAINPGNSGGPLLDSAGRLIGVNTAIRSPSGVSAGIGFAIPVDLVNESVTSLVRGGPRAGLGIRFFDDSYLEGKLGVPGVLFREVIPGSAAAEAGLQPTEVDGYRYTPGDAIVAINDVPVQSRLALIRTLEGLPVGTEVKLRLRHGRSEREVTIKLQPLPDR